MTGSATGIQNLGSRHKYCWMSAKVAPSGLRTSHFVSPILDTGPECEKAGTATFYHANKLDRQEKSLVLVSQPSLGLLDFSVVRHLCPRPDSDSDTDADLEITINPFAMPTLGVAVAIGIGVENPDK